MTPLQQQIQQYQNHHPNARAYTIAQELGVSELEILEAATDKTVTYLGNAYRDLLPQLAPLGKVMALTRNAHAVSEIRGVYDQVSFMEKAPVGIAHNALIDLRYFTTHWAHAYAVQWTAGKRHLHSFQFFDRAGQAIHKIYTTPSSNLDAYQSLVRHYAVSEGRQTALQALPTPAIAAPELSKTELMHFQTDWLNMQDTHDFFQLLKRYGLQEHRQRAFELAPEGYAYRVAPDAIVGLLEQVATEQTPIMVFLGNGACLQIFSGTVQRLVPMEAWYNILDRDFNLHLQLDAIAQAWVVKKCTADGIVTSLELFDQAGTQLLYCFGQRKPGTPELLAWQAAIEQLQPLASIS